MRLLIVEDEIETAKTVQESLTPLYIVDVAYTGRAGLMQAQINDYDLLILDNILPDLNGIDICRELRTNNISTPILMLTGKQEVTEKVKAFDSGADDYLTKPFSIVELQARIRALLRRNTAHLTTDRLMVADLEVEIATRRVSRQGKVIFLRRKEYALLEYLLRNRGRVVTRAMILEHVWDDGGSVLTNTVDVHIKYLRDKIDRGFPAQLIKTVSGVGYKIEG
jgi:DNA-binding response OmpR family regulator